MIVYIAAVGSFTVRKAWVSGESSPVAKDSFNPPPLVLKARATTIPCLASWLSGDAALHLVSWYTRVVLICL